MYAMQYTVKLPTDYDMRIIRDRVARTGHLLDGFPGLQFKAYLIRESSQGAVANEYAPFYVWDDIDGMRAFCWGEPGYSAIVRDFGRHPIQDWTGIGAVEGPAGFEQARSMSITTRALPAGVAPAACVDELTGDFLTGGTTATVRRVAALDITTWTLLLAELSGDDPDPSTGYQVLHVSTKASESP